MMDQVDNFFNILEEGDIRISREIKKAYCLMGKTKAGKTTSSYYLSNLPLKGYVDVVEKKYRQQTNRHRNALIGKQSKSQTQIPNFFPIVKSQNVTEKDELLIDFPGFGDSKGVYRIISNAYFNYQVFLRAQSMKFIIVISSADLQKSSQIILTLKSFMNNFNNFNSIKNSILQSTVLLITKVPRNEDTSQLVIKQFIDKFSISDQTQQLKCIKYILENMLTKKKIFKFLEAVENLSAEKNNILTQIDIVTKYKWWQRERTGQKLSMNNISYSIIQQVMKHKQDSDQGQKLRLICNQMKNKYSKITQNAISVIFKTLFKDAMAEEQSDKFLELIQKIETEFFKYNPGIKVQRDKFKANLEMKFTKESSKQTEKQQKKSQYWIRKMKVIDRIDNFINTDNYLLTDFKRSFEWIEAIEQKIISILYTFKQIAKYKKNIETIENYVYIIYRMFEQVKLFFLLLDNNTPEAKNHSAQFQFFDFIMPLRDNLNDTLSEKQESKRKYALSYEIKEGLEPKKYFQTLQFFKTVKQSPKQQENKALRFKIIKLSVLSSQYQLSHCQNINLIESIKNINLCRIDLERQLLASQNQQFVSLMINTIRILAQFLLLKKNTNLAIICYNSINDAFRVIQIMSTQASRQSNQILKRLLLIELGKYSSTHGRKQLSMKSLQEAYSLSKGVKQYKEVSELLSIVSMSSESENSKNYISRLMQEKFYVALSTKINNQIQALIERGN